MSATSGVFVGIEVCTSSAEFLKISATSGVFVGIEICTFGAIIDDVVPKVSAISGVFVGI